MTPEILPNGNIRISIPVTIKTQGGRKRIVAKSSEKAFVKRFCEKNFTEFLSDLKNGRRFLSSPSFIEITKVEQDFYIKQATNMIE